MVATDVLQKRIKNRSKKSLLDVNTKLDHFALISYAVPVKKVAVHIPKPFKLWTFEKNGEEFSLVSAVPFKDQDFSFYRLLPFIKLKFFQTNYRTYLINENTGEASAWFFGTTLSSWLSAIPKYFWKMPWERGKYKFNFQLENEKYLNYNLNFESKQGDGKIQIQSTNQPMDLLEGFSDISEQELILTHPVKGFYKRGKNVIGTYEIWHPKMELHEATYSELYFELYEKLGFLTREEMHQPHSVLITPQIEFDILLPPGKLKINL